MADPLLLLLLLHFEGEHGFFFCMRINGTENELMEINQINVLSPEHFYDCGHVWQSIKSMGDCVQPEKPMTAHTIPLTYMREH